MLASILAPLARADKAPARFVRDLFLGTSGGYPLGPFLASSGAPLVRFLVLLEDVGSKFASKFKDSRATNCTNHTLEKSKQGFKPALLITNPNKTCNGGNDKARFQFQGDHPRNEDSKLWIWFIKHLIPKRAPKMVKNLQLDPRRAPEKHKIAGVLI